MLPAPLAWGQVAHSIDEALKQPEEITELRLAGGSISKLPEEVARLKNLQVLRLSVMSKLKTFHPDLAKLQDLRQVHIINCNRLNFKQVFNTIKDLEQLRKIDLYNNSLEKLPEEVSGFPNLEYLDLGGNDNLDVGRALTVLAGANKLRTLRLYGLRINELPPAIGELESLERLDLSNNWLFEVPSPLYNLKMLHFLNVSNNYIDVLNDSIATLSNLDTLNLAFNELPLLPDSLRFLRNLKKLDLSYNRILEFDQSIAGLPLRDLNISGNTIADGDSLFQVVAGMNRLEKFRAGGCQIRELSPDTRLPEKLTELYLFDNRLERLPKAWTELSKLQVLDLAGNSLQNPVPQLCQMKKLRTLNLSGNPLMEMDSLCLCADKWRELKTLKLNNCGLNRIPSSARFLGRVEVLDLGNNQFTALPPITKEWFSVRRLSLDQNLIEKISPEFYQLKKLRFLTLRANRLRQLPEGKPKWKELRYLDLSVNNLLTLPKGFANLDNLETLLLEGNMIEEMPQELTELEQLQYIDIRRNYLSTSTRMKIIDMFPEAQVEWF